MRKSRTWMHATPLICFIVAAYCPQMRGQGKAQASLAFNEHIIASDLRGGYHVAIADLNRDGRPDIIALAAGGPDLVWYENPGWERHVLISGLLSMINCAPGDAQGRTAYQTLSWHGSSPMTPRKAWAK